MGNQVLALEELAHIFISGGKRPLTIHQFLQLTAPFKYTIYCLLVSSADNSFDQDQARQNVWSDLDPNCLTF